MKLEDIKVGEKYKLELICILNAGNVIMFETPTGDHLPLRKSDLKCVSPINLYEPLKLFISNRIPETYPKYDPNRPFREKDIVRYKPLNGRECPAMPCDEFYREKTLTVVANEDCNHRVLVQTQDGREKYIMFCYLELVTPVEELELYKVNHVKELELFEVCYYEMGDDTVEKEGELHKMVMTIYWYGKSQWDRTEEEAKAAAEAERDRLNAEYRKDQNNG